MNVAIRDWQALNTAIAPRVDLPPIVVTELTSFGWRGLTEDGEILNVNAKHAPHNGAKVVNLDGREIGFRIVAKPSGGNRIDSYLQYYRRATALLRQNKFRPALKAINNAMRIAATTRARFTRGMILLALGRWPEGFRDYQAAEYKPPFFRPIAGFALEAGLKPWCGENLAGKRLLLIHGHGFGDTIMMLRFIPRLRAMGAQPCLMVPPPLESLAAQFAPTTYDFAGCDYFCTILQMMGPLGITPGSVTGAPYLEVDAALADKWRERITPHGRRRVGVAWSVGKYVDGDYPRPIPLPLLVQRLPDVEIVSVQKGAEGEVHGVQIFDFEDFADCAAFMSTLDAIVSVDTAALHLAGAIGHPRVFGLLSHWASWRWQAQWYPQIQWCQQEAPGDWTSALTKLPRDLA